MTSCAGSAAGAFGAAACAGAARFSAETGGGVVVEAGVCAAMAGWCQAALTSKALQTATVDLKIRLITTSSPEELTAGIAGGDKAFKRRGVGAGAVLAFQFHMAGEVLPEGAGVVAEIAVHHVAGAQFP